MKLTSLTKLAMVSAVALGVAFYGGASDAANEIGSSIQITVNGEVENDLDITLTDGDIFFSAVGQPGDTATGVMAPDGTLTHDTGTGYGLDSAEGSSFVWDEGAANVVPSIEVTDNFTFDDTLELFVGIDPAILPVDLTCGPVAGNIRIASITTDQATPLVFTIPEGGPPDPSTPGHGPLVGGVTTVSFGLSFETLSGLDLGDIVSGVCGTPGTFNVVLSY